MARWSARRFVGGSVLYVFIDRAYASTKRRKPMTKIDILSLFFMLFVGIVYIMYDVQDGRRYIKYDCRLAEVAPDYPQEVVNQCRSRK